MRKRILGAAVLFGFIVSLTAASNVKEDVAVKEIPAMEGLVAGSIRFAHSFTPESDEKTEIEKKESIIVGTAYDDDLMQEKIRNTQEEQIEEIAQTDQIVQETPTEQEIQTAQVLPENRWHITLSPDEMELLARIVWLESQGEPVEGQQAVVEVVFNRMRSEVYPDTLYEVLSQKNPVQFCSFKNRDRAKPTQKEYDSIQQVLDGKTRILRDDTMYFSTFPLTEHVEVKIGGHYFCY
ncbi:MAG TPA: cell wall hydrolase [Roseburia sp.]|nr:cell wall hydrolase [Roseburia sp.]